MKLLLKVTCMTSGFGKEGSRENNYNYTSTKTYFKIYLCLYVCPSVCVCVSDCLLGWKNY